MLLAKPLAHHSAREAMYGGDTTYDLNHGKRNSSLHWSYMFQHFQGTNGFAL